jgi:hypothetical protein
MASSWHVEPVVHLIGRDRLLTARANTRESALRGLTVRALLGEEVDAGFEGHHGIPPTASGPQKVGTNRPLDGLTWPRENRCRLVQIQEATCADFPLQQAVADQPLDRDAKCRPWGCRQNWIARTGRARIMPSR